MYIDARQQRRMKQNLQLIDIQWQFGWKPNLFPYFIRPTEPNLLTFELHLNEFIHQMSELFAVACRLSLVAQSLNLLC